MPPVDGVERYYYHGVRTSGGVLLVSYVPLARLLVGQLERGRRAAFTRC